jgi:long-chain acyl-CoA synthetase
MNVAILGEQEYERNGAYTKVIYEGRQITNRELLGSSRRLAGSLAARGVGPGDRVVVMLANCPEVPVTFGAILRLGAVVVPVLFLLAEEEIRHILTDAGAKVAITDPEFLPKLASAASGLEEPPLLVCHGVLPEGAPAGTQVLETLISEGAETGVADRAADDLAVLSYTSGTTGRPKGVMLSHGNALFNAKASAAAVDVRDGDRSIQTLPLAHSFGIGAMLTGQLFKATGLMLRWFSPDGFFSAVQEGRANNGSVVPTMLSFLLADPRLDETDWSSLRWLVSGGGPLPQDLADSFEQRTGVRVLQGYGLTETSPTISVMRPDDPVKPGSCGRPVDGCLVKIVGDSGEELAPGETGEVICRGPNVMLGYRGMPAETAAVLDDEGWFATGDLGHMDEDGFLYITDRKKDLIIRAGFNIIPRDIEEVLHDHPAVAQAAVVGAPHPDLGEEVVAFVVKAGEVDEATLKEHCVERLAKYKTPAHIVFADALPISGIGKILRRELRDEAVAAVQGASQE